MAVSHPILSRLQTGRPILVGSDPAASLRARGVDLHGPAALGKLLREHPGVVRDHYHQEIQSGADVLSCLTADTLPRALQQIGMPFRAAALTGDAVELALEAAEAAPRPVLVAGVLGNTEVSPVPDDRLAEELGLHAARLATAGAELILARGSGERMNDARHAAVTSAVATGLPTWAVAALDLTGFTADSEPADAVARAAFADGAQLALFEIPAADVGLGYVDRLLAAAGAHHHVGFAVAAGPLPPEEWAADARRLLDAGARVIGGARGATSRHLAALSALLRGNERQSIWPRAV